MSDHTRGTRALHGVVLLTGLASGGMVYTRVADARLNLATGLLLTAAAWTALFLLAEIVSTTRPALRNRLRLLVVTLGAIAFGSEMLLRAGAPSLRTYFERNGETTYRSLSSSTAPTWFQVPQPNHDLTWTTSDFVHSRRTNSLGLSEREVPVAKADSEYRIVALGDSFTEGVGTDAESTWVKVMERALRSRIPGHVVTTLNAGTSGSDFFFDYVLLREKLLGYSPDLVITALNWTDVDDVVTRGGMERFQPDGTVRARLQPPWWEWIYGSSFVTRLVAGGLGYDQRFIRRSRLEDERRRALEQIRSLVPAYTKLASEHRFRWVVVFQPLRDEAIHRAYSYEVQSLIDDLRQRGEPRVIDVLARWSTDASFDTPERWYWPTDLHHNRDGYAALGAAIAEGLIEHKIGPGFPGHTKTPP